MKAHLVFFQQNTGSMNITYNNLVKTFSGNTAVDIDKLEIHENTLLGLVGNNGAGKTTLFRLTLDLLKADTGNVEMSFCKPDNSTFTTDVRVDEEWKVYTGAYIDESFLIDFLTPEEYFEFIAKVNNIDKDTLKSILEKYAPFMSDEILGKQKLIRNMSAGNKQKIGIISAILNRPQLLILDEPFNFLDPTSQNMLKKILVNYKNETGATIMVSSHNLTHTVDISSRIVVMEHGRIVKDLDNNGTAAREELEEYFNR